ncbi:MAG TPA: lytic transglycosylase domain-containing protein [Desulfotomaculum sp.]|nr:MAG: lytic transglycosylase [Desulfotomaculum sp. BICA1-6]HBX24593.1 lytic transglycosylase domain-containing protein [Desulfotomaculum sp.]
MARRYRINIFRLLLLILLITAVLNYDTIIKQFYPMPYYNAIIQHSANAGIDPYLLTAIMKTESNFNPNAVSPKGARGLMQIMPETGEWIARQSGTGPFHPDLLFDPDTCISMGAWYIADLQQEFGGNKIMVLAAYNGGRGNVRNWLDEEKISGNIRDIENIPFPETRNFVSKVLWNYKVYSWLYGKELRHKIS